MRLFFRPLLITFILMTLAFSAVAQVPVRRAVPLDFDGDGKTDLATVRISQNPNDLGAFTWYIRKSSDASAIVQRFGNLNLGDKLVPLDYDGDGKTDIAIYRGIDVNFPDTAPGRFYILQSATGSVRILHWGIRTDSPYLSQDFDGDGKADPTVVRNGNCVLNQPLTWYILLSGSNYQQTRVENFGLCRSEARDRPIRGDFDGDGKADLAFYREYELNPDGTRGALSNTYNIKMSGKRKVMKIRFDGNNQTIFEADFDGDGKTDFARPVYILDGEYTRIVWQFIHSSNGRYFSLQYGYQVNGGFVGDSPAPGDYDGDGKTDLAVFRGHAFTQNYFVITNSQIGNVSWWQWGFADSENIPVKELYLR